MREELTIKAAAKILGKTRAYTRVLCRRGKIVSRFDSILRVLMCDLESVKSYQHDPGEPGNPLFRSSEWQRANRARAKQKALA